MADTPRNGRPRALVAPLTARASTHGGVWAGAGRYSALAHVLGYRCKAPSGIERVLGIIIASSVGALTSAAPLPAEVLAPDQAAGCVLVQGCDSRPDHELTARRLVEVSDIGTPVVSPDRSWGAVEVQTPSVATNTVTSRVMLIDLKWRSAPRWLGNLGEARWNEAGVILEHQLIWSPASDAVYYAGLERGEVQLWRLRLSDGQRTKVTSERGDVLDARLSPAGDAILLVVDADRQAYLEAEEAEKRNGILLDASTFVEWPLTANRYYNGRWVTARWKDAKSLIRLGETKPTLKAYDLSTGRTRAATTIERDDHAHRERHSSTYRGRSVVEVAWSGANFAAIVDRSQGSMYGEGERALVWTTNGGRTFRECSQAICGLTRRSELSWSADGSLIQIATMILPGTTELRSVRALTGHVRVDLRRSGAFGSTIGLGRFRSSPCPKVGDYLLCAESSAAQPPRLVRINLASGDSEILFDPNSQLATAALIAQPLSWSDRWRRSHNGMLVRPRGSVGQLPLIITSYHCGGFLRGGNGGDNPELVLAARGFAVLCVNSTPSELFDKPHPNHQVEKGLETALRTALDGWESAVDYLAALRLIDRSRVGISGTSFGAEVVGYGLFQSTYFAAAAASGPPRPLDPSVYWFAGARGSQVRASLNLVGLRSYEESSVKWRKLSPAINADAIRAPFLIQSSETEFRAGLELYTRLVDLDRRVEFFVFPDELHNKFQPAHRLAQYQRNVDWFRFWLQGHEDPDPAKAEQYARWRAMKRP